jgi:uncharacterized protein (DUF1684 family)
MKKVLLSLIILTSTTLIAQRESAYYSNVNQYRTEKDREFRDTSSSILPNEEALNFEHLNYFQPNEKFNVIAKFKKKIGNDFAMTTSSGKKKLFRQYGILCFTIDEKEFELPIYQNIKLMVSEKYKDYIFIPFTDLTNGSETYGGGRYIEATKPTGKTFQLDFNYAFNPYCHYTTGYNCPIPPKENFLDIRIEAGEQVFETDEH